MKCRAGELFWAQHGTWKEEAMQEAQMVDDPVGVFVSIGRCVVNGSEFHLFNGVPGLISMGVSSASRVVIFISFFGQWCGFLGVLVQKKEDWQLKKERYHMKTWLQKSSSSGMSTSSTAAIWRAPVQGPGGYWPPSQYKQTVPACGRFKCAHTSTGG